MLASDVPVLLRRVGGLALVVSAMLGTWGCLPREPVGDVGAPDLATVQSRIFTSRCATADCHGGPDPRDGMNLEPGMAVPSLVGILAHGAPQYRVVPGDSENSYLMHKLRGTQGDVGGKGKQMPLDGTPLTSAELALVAAWIDGLTVPLPSPIITSITPPAASVGSLVQIAGENFGLVPGNGVVTFGGIDTTASVTSWGATAIEVEVPAGLALGPTDVVVEVAGQASASFAFDVVPPSASIIAVLPDTSVVGATVVVRGSNFGDTRGGSVVRFGAVAAVYYVSWASGRIEVAVPVGAGSGTVAVTVGGVTSNAVAFFVVEPKLSSLQAAVFDRRCTNAGCHGSATGAPTPATDCPMAATTGSLDLRPGMALGSLVGVDSCERPGTLRVTSGNRTASYLYQKISQSSPPAGEQMPGNGTPLPPEVQNAIGTWIDLGAPNN